MRFTVRADLPVSASIALEDPDASTLRHSADSTNLSIEYIGERTAEHALIVENDNPVPVELVVEISMGLRGRTPRTMIEDAVNVVCDALERPTARMVLVFPAKRSPGREDGAESADSSQSTGA